MLWSSSLFGFFLFSFIFNNLSEAQRFRIPNRRNSHPVPAFRYTPHHNRGHNLHSFTQSQGFMSNRQDSSREIFQTHPGQQLSPTHDTRRHSIFRFQNKGISGHKTAKHPFDSSERLSRPAPSVPGKHDSPQKLFHANPHKISKPEFSFLSAMSNNFKPAIPPKLSHQNHLRPPLRKWTPINPVLPNAEVSGPSMFNPVQTRRAFQPTYVDKRPRQIHQRRFQPAVRIPNGILSEQGALASPVVPNVIPHTLPENTAIAHAQKKSDLVKKDISLQTPTTDTKAKLDDLSVAKGPVQTAVLPLSVDSATKPITLPLQNTAEKKRPKKMKTKIPKPGVRKGKKKISKQTTKKPSKSAKSKALLNVQRKTSKSKSKKTEESTPAPSEQTESSKTTTTPTTTEEAPIDDDFLPGGASGSWEMPDHDFVNSGSQEVMNAFGRERFLPGCLCTMFCGHGYEFAGFCGASSAEFFRPRLSKCCPVKNSSGGSSRYMPFLFDD